MPERLRIVSLIASATEIVCALGLGGSLVGRSHECDYPPSVLGLPQCTRPKFPTGGSSSEIDARVKQILEQSLSVYLVDSQLLDSLQPTHIITQSQCEVCAVSIKDVEQAVCRLVSSQPRIVDLKPDTLDDLWSDIKKVADALGVVDAGDELIEQLRYRLRRLEQRASPWAGVRVSDCTPKLPARFPRVAFIEWIDPLMAGGNWMPELIAAAGGVNVIGVSGQHAPPVEFSDLVQSDPDIILVAPCGFDLERTLQEMPTLTGRPGWRQLRAVEQGAVFVADGNQFFNRPGPRLIDSAELIAQMIDSCDKPNEQSQWWRRLTNADG